MCVCALGSRDNSVSIWLTGLLRPVVVIENLFNGPVLDLSWSTLGHNLLACSYDGTVALLKFCENEIGKTLTKSQKVLRIWSYGKLRYWDDSRLLNSSFLQDQMYEKVYGTSAIGHRPSNSLIIEDPILEKLADEKDKPKNENHEVTENKEKTTTSTPTKAPAPVSNKQIETRTSDGRRRITPICVAPAPDIG